MSECNKKQNDANDVTVAQSLGLTQLGFLPEKCVKRLPEKCAFASLEKIADMLPDLNRLFKLKDAISNLHMAPTDSTRELNEEEQRRLYVILAMIIHSLVNGSKARWELLDYESLNQLLPSGNI